MFERKNKIEFNKSAGLYDRVRPGYPQKLIDDIIRISSLKNNAEILEIGCGTGQATKYFAIGNYKMTCIDMGDELISIAERKFEKFHNIEFKNTGYEDFFSKGERFDLIYSATAFHWIEPSFGFKRSAEILKKNGWLAVFNNRHIRANDGFFLDVQNVYSEYAPEICKKNRRHPLEEKTENFSEEYFENKQILDLNP